MNLINSDMLNISTPEDQQCETLSQEFYPVLLLSYFIQEICCNIVLYFCALSIVKTLQIKNAFTIKF